MVDSFVSNWVRMARENMKKRKMDWVHLQIGIEGSGKSNTSDYILSEFDPDMTADRIAFDYATLRSVVKTAPEYSGVWIDEGGEMFNARESMRWENRELIKLFARMREKHFFVVICIPELRMLDVNLRNFRLRSLGRSRVIWNRRKQLLEQGMTEFYSRRQALRIWKTEDGRLRFPRPTKVCRIPNMEGTPLWTAYREKKMEFVQQREERESQDAATRDAKRVKEKFVEVTPQEMGSITAEEYQKKFDTMEWIRKGKKVVKKVRVIG